MAKFVCSNVEFYMLDQDEEKFRDELDKVSYSYIPSSTDKYLHREDGPAINWLYGETPGIYYLHGICIRKNDFEQAIHFLNENGPIAFKLRYSK